MVQALAEAMLTVWSLFIGLLGFAAGVALTKKMAAAAAGALAAGQSWVQVKVDSWAWYNSEVVTTGIASSVGLPTSPEQAAIHLFANVLMVLAGIGVSILVQRYLKHRRAEQEEELNRQEEQFRLLRETGSRYGIRSFGGRGGA